MGVFSIGWRCLMLRLSAGQVESLWDEVLPVGVRELPEDLARLDRVLADPELLRPIVEVWPASGLAAGRPTLAMSSFVRLMVVKQRTMRVGGSVSRGAGSRGDACLRRMRSGFISCGRRLRGVPTPRRAPPRITSALRRCGCRSRSCSRSCCRAGTTRRAAARQEPVARPRVRGCVSRRCWCCWCCSCRCDR